MLDWSIIVICFHSYSNKYLVTLATGALSTLKPQIKQSIQIVMECAIEMFVHVQC